MRVLRRDGERVEIELADTHVTVRRFANDQLVDTSSQAYDSLLRAKFRADIACARERAAGFELVGQDAVVALSHAELLTAIDANPDDHDTRLVLADWLTERGDPWGQIIAIQCLKEDEADGDRFDELDRADFELRVAHKSRLWGELATVTVDAGHQRVFADTMHVEWERGFAREIMLDGQRPDLAPLVFGALGTLDVTRLLRVLYVNRATRGVVDQLAARRWPHLRELHVALDVEAIIPDRLEAMVADACVPVLEVLSIDGLRSDQPCLMLARSSLAPRLRALSLMNGDFTPASIRALADAPFDRLETLHVSGVGPSEAEDVLRGRAKHVTVELARERYEL